MFARGRSCAIDCGYRGLGLVLQRIATVVDNASGTPRHRIPGVKSPGGPVCVKRMVDERAQRMDRSCTFPGGGK